ncbi:MAG: ATP-binding protein [Bdellovibrionales bacterium]|nr:ATP-binding protein [Bdellovibrionales bacterium]
MNRVVNLPESNSFFMFGARATGKTWLLRKRLPEGSTIFIDLLSPKDYDRYSRSPSSLSELLATLPEHGEFWIVVDEVQKAPALLDVVHLEIEAHRRSAEGVTDERPAKRKVSFALTGSSARKLKRGRANLLAGRALVRNLFPLVHQEFEDSFCLSQVLQWGSLPGIATTESAELRAELLGAYVHTYLKEEILAEQLAREAPPFRKFLECAAQSNGEITNYSSIAREVGVSANTVQSYYQILEDTLLGYRVFPYHRSIRKRQRVGPKMYLFDCGVVRTLLGLQDQAVLPSSYGYGRAFEHFIFLEMYRWSSYNQKNYEFCYLQTKDKLEIDFIIERPGMPLALVEIKSAERVHDQQLRAMRSVQKDFSKAEFFVLCRETQPRMVEGIHILPWQEGLYALGLAR